MSGSILTASTLEQQVHSEEDFHNTKKEDEGQIFYFLCHESLSVDQDQLCIEFFEEIEELTISSFHTIIYGNGLPLPLLNKRDAVFLPPSVWYNPDQYDLLALGIAQTIIYQVGVPLHMAKLPRNEVFSTMLPSRSLEINKSVWPDIMSAECAAREEGKYSDCPLLVLCAF